ncbi:P-loop NTPase [Microbacterium sp.]|uniref:AAA family ATPase n=1 Tax=Microbacterium sp. TaxID=51671 RepID=UPI00333F7626
MTSVVLALADGARLAADLELEGVRVVAVVSPDAVDPALLHGADALLLTPSRRVLTPALVSACDRAAVRIVPVGDGEGRLVARLGLAAPLPPDTPAWRIAEVLADERPPVAESPSPGHLSQIVAVWGPHGAPGRSTIAVQLAVEFSRLSGRTALLDADTTAPSIAMLLGLGEESPGLAAACRRAELGSLDEAELTRLAVTLDHASGRIDVLAGVNRPARWPEIGRSRLRATLEACRVWADSTVVDLSASFEEEDDGYDLAAPSRHAATTAALGTADRIVAVASADPLGIARFLRGHAELRRVVGSTPITVVVNRLRPGPLGIDARRQVRRTLDRFAGIDDVLFAPFDQRAADAAMLHARPIADVAPRSPLVSAVRRLASSLQAVETRPATAGSSRGSSRDARRPR